MNDPLAGLCDQMEIIEGAVKDIGRHHGALAGIREFIEDLQNRITDLELRNADLDAENTRLRSYRTAAE